MDRQTELYKYPLKICCKDITFYLLKPKVWLYQIDSAAFLWNFKNSNWKDLLSYVLSDKNTVLRELIGGSTNRLWCGQVAISSNSGQHVRKMLADANALDSELAPIQDKTTGFGLLYHIYLVVIVLKELID